MGLQYINYKRSAPHKTLNHLVSRDSQVAEVALSLSDFNPAAKMAPNPDLLSEMRQGAWEEDEADDGLVCVCMCVYLCIWRMLCGNVICRLIQLSETLSGFPAPDQYAINTWVNILSWHRYLKLGSLSSTAEGSGWKCLLCGQHLKWDRGGEGELLVIVRKPEGMVCCW